jgi:hypothetical protein
MENRMRILFAAIVSLFYATAPASAEGSSQGYGMGGWYEQFDPVIAKYNQSGELFRITGHCQSACTMFLGIRNVCVERSARLLFHGSHDRQRRITEYHNNRVMSHYNAALRNYIVAGGYTNTLAFHTISGQDMISKFGYRACPGRA